MWTTTTLIQKCKQHKFSDHVRNDEDRVVKKCELATRKYLLKVKSKQCD